ncbi:hypothetical protein [Marinomonas algicola]|jgi:hypothetical protein|uniref:hypothetical protein n=1 Tax=Marinomonas algicola TaxID=2773454 RepID=UPI00174D836B|nr:hypothetical protein [Marinomonas algicola]
MKDKLADVTFWLAVEISKSDPPVNLDEIYQGSLELDYLYQVLTNRAQSHWLSTYKEELTPVLVNNAFFRAIAFLYDRKVEYERARSAKETIWVKDLLHLQM